MAILDNFAKGLITRKNDQNMIDFGLEFYCANTVLKGSLRMAYMVFPGAYE